MNATVGRGAKAARPQPKKRSPAGYVANAGDHSIAFGMLWDRLPSAKPTQSAIRKAAAKYSASEYVTLPAKDGKRPVGLLPDSAKIEKGASRKTASSAAALLAVAYPGIDNAVFGVLLADNKVAFIGFRAGAPLIGFDRIVSRDNLDELTSDFLREFDEESARTVQFYASADVFPGRNAETFDSEWFGTVPKKALVATRMRRAKSRMLLVVGLVAVALVGYGAFAAYEEHLNEQLKKAKPVLVNPQELYTKSVNEYLAAAASGSITSTAMIDKVNALPLFHQGWRLEKAACTPSECVLSWTNTDGGTYRTFASSPLPGVPEYSTAYKEGMTGLDTSFAIHSEGPKGFAMDELPKQDQFVLYFGSTAQNMKAAGVTITLDKGNVVGMPPTPAGAAPITESVLSSKVVEGTWAMTGDWTFYQALASLPANMTVETLEVGVSGETMSMSVKGKYYVKK